MSGTAAFRTIGLARSSGAAFNPLTAITWTGAYWADDPSWTNPGNGNPVSSWRDGSGNSYDVTQTGSQRPTFTSSVAGLNSHAGVQFVAASSQSLFKSSGAGTSSQPFSLVCVFVLDAAAGGSNANIISDGSNSCIYWGAGGTTVGAYAGSSLAGSVSGTGLKAVRGKPNGASSVVNVNGSNTSGNAGSNTLNSARFLGAFSGVGGYADGTIGFAGWYAGDITAAGQWSAFVSWVSSYYGATIA